MFLIKVGWSCRPSNELVFARATLACCKRRLPELFGRSMMVWNFLGLPRLLDFSLAWCGALVPYSRFDGKWAIHRVWALLAGALLPSHVT